jgi:hypothetical protein
VKQLTIITAAALLLSGCQAMKSIENGTQKLATGLSVALASPYNKLNNQWRGKPLSKFEEKFGTTAERSTSGDGTVSTWKRTIVARIGGSWQEDYTYLPNMTITRRSYIPEHDGPVSCSVALTAKNGTIAQVKTLQDAIVPVAGRQIFPPDTSACQIVFGL